MKSHVRELTELLTYVIIDAVSKCPFAIELDERDIRTIISRTEAEGVSFLTLTLPNFGRDFERSLDQGYIGSNLFRAFRKRRSIPAFLHGMISLVFSSSTGRLLNEPSIEAIEGIRQISYLFKKLLWPCATHRVAQAIQTFKEQERDLREATVQVDSSRFREVSRVLWSNVFSSFLHDDIIPRHGPGQTAERITGNQKFAVSRWHERLDELFPCIEYALPSSAYLSKEYQAINLVPRDEEQPVRVIPVPKTLKGPRIIAIEPVCMQYAQQALSKYLIKCLEASEFTAGHVNFTDQSVNQRLALSSSADGSLATLDLSSASDRVPLVLAEAMFDAHPLLKDMLLACRSERAELPDGDIIHLSKFASMGSATCFPVESMYFYTICIEALLEDAHLPVTSRNILFVSRSVFVYGDDIIVPANKAEVVCSHLQKYCCKVNTDKSFWIGKFRESCGIDAYDGEAVTPTYLRHVHPTHKQSSGIISWVSTSNQFHRKGYWRTAQYMKSYIESITGPLPVVAETSPGLGWYSFMGVGANDRVKHRWHKDLQVDRVSTLVPKSIYRNDAIDGYHALQKCLLSLENRHCDEPLTDKDHLKRTARYGTVTLKRRWTLTY